MTGPGEETPPQIEAANTLVAAHLRVVAERARRTKARWAIVGWAGGLVVSIAVLVLVVWAVIRVVGHFT